MANNCGAFDFVKKGMTCAGLLSKHGITLEQLVTWNPSIKADCTGLWSNIWVCVSVIGHTPSPPTKPTSTNGIETPSPIQGGMVTNCNKFHLVQTATTCISIESYYKLPLKDFYAWNPSVGTHCLSLVVGYWVCVSIVGWTPPQPSPTAPGNGIKTPLPIRAGMVINCNRFHEVQETTTCASIQNYYNISMEQLAEWNPGVGSHCNALVVGYYVCVGVIRTTPTPPAPTPFLPAMMMKCKGLHLLNATTSCDSIPNYYTISMAQTA
ncbi:hypothetical protein EDB82DRAFT_502077 [Fusarium venenatum]|nr:hypothetical protein EDB82DRAFT_502077 [Fusarium venenatum]